MSDIFLILLLQVFGPCAGLQLKYCGGVLKTDTGHFSPLDSNGNGLYDRYIKCVWEIRAAENRLIQLEIYSIDIEDDVECAYDSLSIMDGMVTIEGKHGGLFCGQSPVPGKLVSESRVMTVTFSSDKYLNAAGFNASFVQIDDPHCGYAGFRNGVISVTDVDEGGIYQRVNCLWELKSEDQTSSLSILKFKIHGTDDCETNNLQVFDDGELVGSYCNSSTWPEVIKSSSNNLSVLLMSNGSFEDVEFEAVYVISDLQCGGILTDHNGTLIFPDNEDEYWPSADCLWLLLAPSGTVIMFEFLFMDIEKSFACGFDAVEIYDGHFGQESKTKRFCREKDSNLTSILFSTSNVMSVRFVSDSVLELTGFKAHYSRFKGNGSGVFWSNDGPATFTYLYSSTPPFSTEIMTTPELTKPPTRITNNTPSTNTHQTTIHQTTHFTTGQHTSQSTVTTVVASNRNLAVISHVTQAWKMSTLQVILN